MPLARLARLRALSLAAAALALLVLAGCIDPVSLDTGEPARLVVVDALVTSRDKAHRVRLSLSAAFERSADAIDLPLEDAVVTLEDDQGRTYRFRETARGLYESDPSDLVTQVGRTYTLAIRLADGRRYRSAPEVMRPVASIDAIGIDYRSPTDSDPLGAFLVDAQLDDPAGTPDYYRWQWRRLFKYDPPGPAGPAYFEDGSTETIVEEDRLFDGATDYRADVTSIPFNIVMVTGNGYLVQVQQYSLSPEAFAFWKLVEQQQALDGSIFDPPPDRIRSNVRNVDDPGEHVLGFFTVSDVVQERTCICAGRFPDRPAISPSSPPPTQGAVQIPRPDFFNCDNLLQPSPERFSCPQP